jgi:hypothetical protein
VERGVSVLPLQVSDTTASTAMTLGCPAAELFAEQRE